MASREETGGDDAPRVRHDGRARRYEVWVGEALAGEAVYRDEVGRRVFLHTEVDPAFEGRGLGSRLAKAALTDAREAGLHVVPVCSFIRGYLERHPEFGDLETESDVGEREAG
jgi:predicted GNAT family acetyltransferase